MNGSIEDSEARVRLVKGGTAFGYPVSALRTEQRKGRLAVFRVAGKDYVSEAAIREMEAKCRTIAVEPDPTTATARAMAPAMLSSTAQRSAARASAEKALRMLKKLSRVTPRRS